MKRYEYAFLTEDAACSQEKWDECRDEGYRLVFVNQGNVHYESEYIFEREIVGETSAGASSELAPREHDTTEKLDGDMKRIERDGKFYRMRRGKLVEIPEEWVGQTVYKQSIRKRKTEDDWNRSTRKTENSDALKDQEDNS